MLILFCRFNSHFSRLHIMVFIYPLNLFIIILLIQSRKNTLSKMSIKEAFDDLPSGICFYEESGVTRLVNRKMNDLSIKITGECLLNGKKFISILADKI